MERKSYAKTGMNKGPRIPISLERLVEIYNRTGSIDRTAAVIGTSSFFVIKWLHVAGAKMNPAHRPRKSITATLEEYRAAGSLARLAKMKGCSIPLIRRALLQTGVSFSRGKRARGVVRNVVKEVVER